MRHLWLIGMMGSGKSVVGRILAQRLGMSFVDTDDAVAARTGCSVAQLWGTRGEAAFRELEAVVVAELAEKSPAVVATGGGAVLDPRNVATLRATGKVAWLRATPPTLASRVGDGGGRPLLLTEAGVDRLGPILEARHDRYEDAADMVVETDGRDPEAVADEIEAWWNES